MMNAKNRADDSGREKQLWSVLGCPYCQGELEHTGEVARCDACQRLFPIARGIPSLLREEDAAVFDRFSFEYRRARLRDGWTPLTREDLLALPDRRPRGFQALYWETRRRSFTALERFLAEEGPRPPDGCVVDLGAGFAWLSYRLAQAGYGVVAIDASTDEFFGLGAARAYLDEGIPFLLAQGNLESPPLRDESVVLIVLNASLHYARDLEEALRRCALALKPGGRLIIMDTPVARRPEPGTGKGDRHLGMDELNAALRAAKLLPRWLRVRQGWRWWLYRAKGWARGSERFDFPLVIADRA